MAGRSQGEAKTSLAARARPRGPPRSQSLTSRLVLLAAVPVGVAIALVSFLTAWRDGADGAAAESARLGVSAAVVAAISGSATAAGDRARARVGAMVMPVLLVIGGAAVLEGVVIFSTAAG